MKITEASLLDDLARVLKKHKRERTFDDNKMRESDSPSAAESVMGLLTHLVDLEQKARQAEQRGELRPLSDIGLAVREARKRQGLTVETLADLAGVGPVTIHKVEKGSIQVQAQKLVQIAEALGLELLVSVR